MSEPPKEPNTEPNPPNEPQNENTQLNQTNDKAPKKKSKPKQDNSYKKVQKSPKYSQIPKVTPNSKCELRLLKLNRVEDWLKMEEEYINNCETIQVREQHQEDKRKKLEEVRGSPTYVGTLEEILDDDHAIVSRSMQEFYVTISSFVDVSIKIYSWELSKDFPKKLLQ